MVIVDGKKIAAEILAKLKAEPFDKLGARKFLAVILVGDDSASLSFVKQKEKAAKELGVDFRLYKFTSDVKNDELRDEVRKIAEHKTCGGVIVQLPLPEHINAQYVLNAIPREKDVDVLGERALGAFYASRNPVLPPAVGVVEEIAKIFNFQFPISNVAVVGLGVLVGKPVSMWLMRKAAGLYLLHRGSDFSLLKNADLVISGVGKAGIIKPEMLKAGAGVIDFGYDGGKGDFDPSGLEIRNSKLEISFYTPTPGGTGPILVAKVFENFYKLNSG
jgi:methylenetetrahydrofolate dehydrogenase (NADP+)/methenyltetrahydrofolate cyclohydrolase